MPQCPNCGQAGVRTEDWACQWCGYPLVSMSYKKIPKTYKQLKEERLHNGKPPLREEAEASFMSHQGALPPAITPALEPEPELTLETELEPQPQPELTLETELEPQPELEPEPELEPAEIEITVEELLLAYASDGAAADARFTNKVLKVRGMVSRVEVNDILDVHYIILASADEREFQTIRCLFDKKHGPELSQLAKGLPVTVQGKYDGSLIDIRMRDCVLIS